MICHRPFRFVWHSRHERYKKLKETHSQNPHQTLSSDIQDDPLSQSTQSVWNQHFCDKELCAVIKQDVVRTFPGVEFYRKQLIQDIMINILFCYARENSIMCYRQGMHEILAPILFVMHSDHQAFLHFRDIGNVTDPIGWVQIGKLWIVSFKKIKTITIESLQFESDWSDESGLFGRGQLVWMRLNLSIVTHANELFFRFFSNPFFSFIFAKIMRGIESYYRINDLIPSSSGYFPATPTVSTVRIRKSFGVCFIVSSGFLVAARWSQ